jgi:hypothetical protein
LVLWLIQQFQGTDSVIREPFTIFAHLNRQELHRLLALVFPGILVAALETQIVGAPEITQLALTNKIIATRA